MNIKAFVQPRHSIWIIFLFFLLFPVKRSVELPILIMLIGGLVLAYQNREGFFREPAIKSFTLLFASIWLPMLFSLPGSYDLKATAGGVLAFVRLYLSGLFIIWTLRDQKQVALLVKLLAGLTAFWVVDALFQALTGHDFFGFAQVPSRLNGVFGERHWRLGTALPVLAPFLILTLRSRPVWMVLAALLAGVVVILAGNRGGWVSYALVCLWLIFSETRRRGIPLWRMGSLALVIGLLGAAVTFVNPGARERLDKTLLLFSGDEAKIDQALSHRWVLWKDAFAMIKAHPLNGVGVSAFRFAYPGYAQLHDPFMVSDNIDQETGRPTGAMYAHQMVLEVTAETGLIGLAGLALFYGLLIRYWRRAEAGQKRLSLPFVMGLAAWIFPLNTHASFYSAQWSVMIWVMIAMICATLYPVKNPVRGSQETPFDH